MGKTLWGFYDGEAFMENPPLGIIGVNSPRKGKKKMAVRRRKRTRNARRTHHRKHAAPRRRRARASNPRPRRRRRARRNWISSGMVVPPNPRRRRRSRRSMNPRRRRYGRGHRHNPKLLGLSIPPIKTVAFGIVGFAGPSITSGLLTQFAPSVMQQVTSLGIAGKYLVKIGSVAGLAWLTKRFFGGGQAMSVVIGGSLNIGMSLLYDFVPGILPANPLAMYLPTRPGMQAYVPTRSNLRGIQMQGNGSNSLQYSTRQIPTAAGFPGALQNQVSYGKFGGTAARLYRY